MFAMRTVNNYINVSNRKNQELTDRHRDASSSTSKKHCFLSVRSDLSAVAQKSKTFIMRTDFTGTTAIANLARLTQTTNEAIVASNISTNLGFFMRYFELLPYFLKKQQAFEAVSVEYYMLHKHFKYGSYRQFRNTFFKK